MIVPTPLDPAPSGTAPSSSSRRSRAFDAEFAEVRRALTAVVAGVEGARRPDLDLLADVVPGCVQIAGLLAALTGVLGEHAGEQGGAVALPDVAADLAAMRGLLHRATLVAAPAIADLRRCRIVVAG